MEEIINSNDLTLDHHHLSLDEITTPLDAQLFEFCESDLFSRAIQNIETSSASNKNNSNNYGYEGHTSYHPDMTKYTTDATHDYTTNTDNEINETLPPPPPTATSPSTAAQTDNFSIIFDDPTDDQLEHDISASIDFSPSPPFSVPHHQYYNNNNNSSNNITTNNSSSNNTTNNNNQEPFSIPSLNNHLSLGDHHMMNGPLHQYAPNERWPMVSAPPPPPLVPVLGPPPPLQNDCLPSVPSYIRFRSSQAASAIIDPMMPPFLQSGSMSAPFSAENSGIYTGNVSLMFGNDLLHHELDFQGDGGGLFLSDNLPRVFSCSSELQTLSGETQQLVHGGTSVARLTSEISSLDDPTFKVGKLSVEERKRKIHRYLQKRNERNFSKKIKYACRKTLADSRPRVRGRFAKNDELGEIARTTSSNQEDDIDDDVSLFSSSIPNHQRKVVVKEEEDLESADIFAHISGVNSLKCNYPIQSWI